MASFFLAALALLSAIQVVQIAAEDGGLSWTVYHSWNPNQEFVRRGSLVWRAPINSDGTENASSDKNEFQIINDDESASLTTKDIRDMLEYGWYHVKIQGDSTGDNNFVFQTVPACNLRRANFKDQFEITLPRSSLGDRQDPMTSFAYTPLVSPLAPKTCGDSDDNGDESGNTKSFSSRVSVQLDTPAMALKNILPQSKPPPGIAFVKMPQQPGVGSGQQGGGADGENYEGDDTPPSPIPSPFSFLSKYWYIILPMVILQFIQLPAEDTPAQQGQQEEQQGGNKDSGGAIAPPSAAPQQKARRGKTSKGNKS